MKKSALITLICSLIIVVGAVLASVIGLISAGVIDAEKESLVIKSASALATYNGEPLTETGWSIVSGEVKEGHHLDVQVTGIQTSAGVSENYITVRVLNDKGKNVSSQYDISLRPGTLNVKHRHIGIIADSGLKLYDGKPLEAKGYTVDSPLSLAAGHKLNVVVEGTITEVGEEDNHILKVSITDKDGNDVTRNYNITGTDGKLIVYDPEALVFKSKSAAKEYDGTPLTEHNWELVSGDLQSGDRVEVTMPSSQTEIGTSKNEFTVKIIRTKGGVEEDVTKLYDITSVFGDLTVSKANVTFTSGSAQKVYDGQPLVSHKYDTTAKVSLKEFMLTPSFSGKQTEIGESQNYFTMAIYDSRGNDVTENFNITYKNGNLTVVESEENLPVEITYKSNTDKKTYDGTPLVNRGVKLVKGALKEGHFPEFDVKGTITNAGEVKNEFDVIIRDGAGNDVTGEYFITKENGTLTVNKVKVTVTSKNDQKAYDGTSLTCDEFTTSPADCKEKFSFDVKIIGSQTDIGKSPNYISSVVVSDFDGVDITENFDINVVEGTLSVQAEDDLMPELKVISKTYEKEYDGKPLDFDRSGYTLMGVLKEGHTSVVLLPTQITEVGTVDNEIDIKVYDEEGNDVTGEYFIEKLPGTLTVTKKPLNITANSNYKTYDNTPLEDHGVTQKGLVEGHRLDAVTTGSITNPGTTENIVTEYTIYDENGKDVTSCYEVSVLPGTLTVISGSEAGSANMTGPITDEEFQQMKNEVLYKLLSERNGKIYLKHQSFGSYNGRGWENDVPKYTELIGTEGVSVYYLPAYVLDNENATPDTVNILPMMGSPYVLPYFTTYLGAQTLQPNDSVIVGTANGEYAVKYYTISFLPIGLELPAYLAEAEARYASFVRENYLGIDDETYEYMLRIIDEQGFDVNDPDVINKVAEYIQNAADYNLNYNAELFEQSNVAIAFLDKYQEGVCTHYATAATLLFRALGIPARYTVGYTGDTVKDQQVDVTGANAHAWVEVYIDGFGWINVEVTGTSDNDNDNENEGENEGENNPQNGGKVSGNIGENMTDEQKEEVYFVIESSVAGAPFFKIQNFGNYDPATNTWSYAKEYETLTGDGYSAYYLASLAYENRGNASTPRWIKITPMKDILALPYYAATGRNEMHTTSDVVINMTGSLENNKIYYHLVNSTSNLSTPPASKYSAFAAGYDEFVYDNYLDVDPETREYFEQIIAALRAEDEDGAGFNSDDLDILIYEVSKYIKLAADINENYDTAMDQTENPIISFLRDYQEGTSRHFSTAATLMFRTLGIPARYTVGFVKNINSNSSEVKGADMRAWVEVYREGCGWMYVDVNPSTETIKLDKIKPSSTVSKYSGNTLNALQTVTGFEVLENDYDLEGYTYEAKITGSVEWLGKVQSIVEEFRIYNNRGRLVYEYKNGTVITGGARFAVTFLTGEVHQYLEKLTYVSKDSTKTYDGYAPVFEIGDVTMSGTLHSGYEDDITITAKLNANAGSQSNEFKVTIYKDGVDVTDHYLISYDYGTSDVKKKEIEIYAVSATKPYDGTALTCNQISYIISDLVEGDEIVGYTVVGSQTVPGKTSNIVQSVVIKRNGIDVTKNYAITYREGLLTVTPPET